MVDTTDRYPSDPGNPGAQLEERLRRIEQELRAMQGRNPLNNAAFSGVLRNTDATGNTLVEISPNGVKTFDANGDEVVEKGLALVVAAVDASPWEIARASFVCDGVDDQVQIQAALDQITNVAGGSGIQSGTVLLTSGSFVLGAPLVTNHAANQTATIQGAGAVGYELGTTIVRNFTTGVGITTDVAVVLRDLCIIDRADVSNTSALVRKGAGAILSVERCFIINWNNGPGVFVDGGNDLVVSESYIEGSTFGIGTTGGSAIAQNIYLATSHIYGGDHAVGWEPGGACRMDAHDCHLQGGVRVNGNISNVPMPVVNIKGGRIVNEDALVWISNASKVFLENIDMAMTTATAVSGIRISNVDDGGSIRNNRVFNGQSVGHHGIWLLDCEAIAVEDNDVIGWGQTTDDTYSGILLDGDTNDCKVTGNRVRSTTANKLLYGVRVDDSTCDNNLVEDNDLRSSCKTAGNEFSDAGTGTRGWKSVEVAHFAGGLVAPTSSKRRVRMPRAAVLGRSFVDVDTAPTGASLISDVNKNGTTVYTTAGNRPTVAIGAFANTPTVFPDVKAVAAGDYLTADIDQVGSTVAGADLTVMQEFMPL